MYSHSKSSKTYVRDMGYLMPPRIPPSHPSLVTPELHSPLSRPVRLRQRRATLLHHRRSSPRQLTCAAARGSVDDVARRLPVHRRRGVLRHGVEHRLRELASLARGALALENRREKQRAEDVIGSRQQKYSLCIMLTSQNVVRAT